MENWLGRFDRPLRTVLALTLMAAVAGWIGAAAGGSAIAQSKKPAPGPAPVECVAVTSEASFASVGYDHLVHLTNNCKRRTACTVKTDVNSDVANLELAPGERQTIVTWRGSPARVFKADVTCLEK
jgi:hypothetical protein